ncbi:hypothetical protein EG328_006476 [Venturia inaequalis]|uniref:DUF3669 domain-containing protein n=1 Tax=Venturia inaequalis TaxID=5025 RepID=A0A8H3UIF1_VENIN|nr:hypothetical protein EG328_006476 [Venturia inaequalis]
MSKINYTTLSPPPPGNPTLRLTNDAHPHPLRPFRHIGHGFCGSVWAVEGSGINTCAIKREDGGEGRSVQKDFTMHQKINSSLQALKRNSPERAALASSISIPACYQYVERSDDIWWSERLERFPSQFQVACNALITDRIPPFRQSVRDLLVNYYCPSAIQESAKNYPANSDCLIRPYLGRRRRNERKSMFKAFSLRNYPLHIDQMEELGLDSTHYARVMAETLAIMHWAAQVDGNDVEFVLAPPRPTTTDPSEAPPTSTSISTSTSDPLGEHTIWILDFDCCRDMPMDESGIDQAWRAFYKNDPFYPRPNRDNPEDQRLWEAFKERFMEASAIILGPENEIAHFPGLLVAKIEDGNPFAAGMSN